MVIDNTKTYIGTNKAIKIAEFFMMLFQIIVLLIIFICSLHIMFCVFESHALDSFNPLFEGVRNFSSFVFGNNIKQDPNGIDGREVVFILFGMLVIYFTTQIRNILNTLSKNVDLKLVEEKEKVENAFNEELQQDLYNKIIAQNAFVIAIQFKAKWIAKESIGEYIPPKEEVEKLKIEAIGKFYENIKTYNGLNFSKDNDILIISSKNINQIDSVIEKVWEYITAVKTEYRARKLGLRVKMAIDVHKPEVSVSKVYKNLAQMFNLNAFNEILCFGNFKNRYEMIENSAYYVAIKGKYEMIDGQEETIWSLFKK